VITRLSRPTQNSPIFLEPNSTTRTPSTNTGYGHHQRTPANTNTTNEHHQRQKFATSQHLDMSRCWALALRCGKFIVSLSVGGVHSRCPCSGVWLLLRRQGASGWLVSKQTAETTTERGVDARETTRNAIYWRMTDRRTSNNSSAWQGAIGNRHDHQRLTTVTRNKLVILFAQQPCKLCDRLRCSDVPRCRQ